MCVCREREGKVTLFLVLSILLPFFPLPPTHPPTPLDIGASGVWYIQRERTNIYPLSFLNDPIIIIERNGSSSGVAFVCIQA